MKTHYVAYEKLSKRKQKELSRQKRGSWGAISPVTRKPMASKVYNRAASNPHQPQLSDAHEVLRCGMTIELYWHDLTPEKQAEILDLLGDNQNWDVFPFCTLAIDDEGDEDE